MNKALLQPEVQQFLKDNLDTSLPAILFAKDYFEAVTNVELVRQIESRRKCDKKLPLWFHADNIIYQDKLNIEQTSSEVTAAYKVGLVQGKVLADLTGGFGIDSYYFSKRFNRIHHCEVFDELSAVAKHNAQVLGATNIDFYNGDGLEFIREYDGLLDCIYIDPSRRNNIKGKVFMLKDCLPDVPENLELLFHKSDAIVIKTSPILDISMGLSELQYVAEIHVVAVNNEVKELLWLLKKGYEEKVKLVAVNIKGAVKQQFSYLLEEEELVVASYGLPQTYLYEPNAAIMKSGGFKSIAAAFQLHKLHNNSHLYTGDAIIDFPGRSFRINEVIPYHKKTVKSRFQGTKANITTRNFPDKPDVLKKNLKIKDGGEVYLFFTTDINATKIILVTEKIENKEDI